jgi:hypothetical protein
MKILLLHFRLALDSLSPIGRHITFSKQKAGIVKKVLVLLLLHLPTYAARLH